MAAWNWLWSQENRLHPKSLQLSARAPFREVRLADGPSLAARQEVIPSLQRLRAAEARKL